MVPVIICPSLPVIIGPLLLMIIGLSVPMIVWPLLPMIQLNIPVKTRPKTCFLDRKWGRYSCVTICKICRWLFANGYLTIAANDYLADGYLTIAADKYLLPVTIDGLLPMMVGTNYHLDCRYWLLFGYLVPTITWMVGTDYHSVSTDHSWAPIRNLGHHLPLLADYQHVIQPSFGKTQMPDPWLALYTVAPDSVGCRAWSWWWNHQGYLRSLLRIYFSWLSSWWCLNERRLLLSDDNNGQNRYFVLFVMSYDWSLIFDVFFFCSFLTPFNPSCQHNLQTQPCINVFWICCLSLCCHRYCLWKNLQ